MEAATVLAATVQKQASEQFDGTVGQAVSIRRPFMLDGNQEGLLPGVGERPDGKIAVESKKESVLNITLDQHVYSAVQLTDAELSLEIADFASQVALPQTDAVVNRLERIVASALEQFSPAEKTTAGKLVIEHAPGDYLDIAQKIRFQISFMAAELTANNIPGGGRFLVLGANVAGLLMNDPNLTRVSEAGTDTALREAVIGKLYGFTLIQSNHIDPDSLYAYHPSAVQLVTRAPIVPPSVTFGASQSQAGYALRWIRDYMSETASERSFFSAYCGIAVVDDTYRDKRTGKVQPAKKVIRGIKAKVELKPTTVAAAPATVK
ncbi:hypothetical protein [Streptomyces sp. NPDC048057]|uniref:hypothetical protein n=1 Tax=Streptomyces sp. NPDC048057 TaxID=3155628 RepID=UPI0033D505B5